MGNTIVIKLAGNGQRAKILADLARLFPRRPKQLTNEQQTWLALLAKRGWNDFEVDLALDARGLPGSVDQLRGFLGLAPKNLGALHVEIGVRRLSIIDHWKRVTAGQLPAATLFAAAVSAHRARAALEGVVSAVGQVDSVHYTRSVTGARDLLVRHDAPAVATRSIARKLGADADFLQAKTLVLALARAHKLTPSYDALIANALFGTECVTELREIIARMPAKRRERILLEARPAGFPFGRPKPEGAWLYYDLEPSPAIRKHVARVIAKTRKEELPAKRAKELLTLFTSA